MSNWNPPENWYWTVNDTNPSTQVWKSSIGAMVLLADSDYVAFLAAGNIATIIDTMANLLVVIDSFNQSLVRPGYVSISISGGNHTFTSPLNALIPKTINISTLDTSGRAVILPQENLCGSIALGDSVLISNDDAVNSVDVLLNDGTTKIATILAGGAALIIPVANSDTNGTWEVFYFSSINGAASGKLLIAQGTSAPAFEAMSGDATITNTGVVTVTKAGGPSFATTLLNLTVFTVSTLPSSGRVTGSVALVSDATSNILIGAGGGSAYALVAWNGAAWVAV